jgi:L-aspartate oxidase
VTAAAPERIEWLLELGARFDRGSDGALILGREAGHRHRRIVHANGDATGAELMRTLRTAVRRRHDIEVLEHTWVVDLVRQGDAVAGVAIIDAEGARDVLLAPAVVLATGGIGRLYSATTNPEEVTGDGLGMAIRAGARIADPEFMQFHPTALRSTLDPMPLLTEALRGAGAQLVDDTGHRFMLDEHPDAELAPRDIVARANWRRLQEGHDVYLDATQLGDSFPERFPTVFASAIDAGIDPRSEWLPVSPAAHYHMGGIDVDDAGRASLQGLYVCGEAAATGLHGANRLASNSLLEGLVFGAEVAAAIKDDGLTLSQKPFRVPVSTLRVGLDDDREAIAGIRRLMWDYVGVMRTGAGMERAQTELASLAARAGRSAAGRNMAAVAELVATTALARQESRGGHYRLDFPETDPTHAVHTRVTPEPETTVELPALVRGAA